LEEFKASSPRKDSMFFVKFIKKKECGMILLVNKILFCGYNFISYNKKIFFHNKQLALFTWK